MNILIAGSGNMGLTYAQSFLRSRIVKPEQLMVLCRTEEKAGFLQQIQEGRFFSDPGRCVQQADLIIFAVKPQDVPELFSNMAGFADPSQVFISIKAGISSLALRLPSCVHGH